MKKLFLFSFLAVFLAWLWFGGISLATTVSCTEWSPVAKIWDEQCYETLADAITDVTDGGTVTLLDDVAISATQEIKKNLTINLNEHNIAATNARALWIKNGDVEITGNGTISANKEWWEGSFADSSSVIRVGDNVANDSKAKLIVWENVTVSSSYCYGITVFGKNNDNNNETIDMELVVNGKVEVTGVNAAISGNGTNSLEGTTMTIGSTAEISASQTYAIYHPGRFTLTVNGRVNGGIEAKAGEVVINDGAEIIATATTQSHTTNKNGPSTAGYAIAAVNNGSYVGTPTITINGGTVSGKIDTLDDDNAHTNASADIDVSWGTFNSELAPEHIAANANKNNIIVNLTSAVAKVWNIEFSTLDNAIAAANEDETITLLDNINGNHQIVIDKKITLDWDWKTLSVDFWNVTPATGDAWWLLIMANWVTVQNLKVDWPNRSGWTPWKSWQIPVKVYNSTGVILKNIEVNYGSEALQFNGSTVKLEWTITLWSDFTYAWFEAKNSTVDVSEATIDKAVWIWDNDWFTSTVNWDGWIKKCKDETKELETCNTNGNEYQWWQSEFTITKAEVSNWTIEVSAEKAIKWTEITLTATPASNNYTFWSWTVKDSEWNAITVSNDKFTMPASNVTVSATFSYKSTSSWWGGGGGGSSSSSCKNLPSNAVANNSKKPSSSTNYFYDTDTTKVCSFVCKEGYEWNKTDSKCEVAKTTTTWDKTDETKVDEPKVDENNENAWTDIGGTPSNEFSKEFNDAYTWAFKNGITTMDSIEKADMNAPLTRIAMAKMLSQYAINVLGKTPDTTKVVPTFPDVDEQLNKDYNDWVTLAYQLGIMWINIDSFRPFDLVTRAEFGTALSRMLFGLSDGEEDLWYKPHLDKLMNEKIITIDTPDLQELRGYVMIMLMRSAQ